MGKKTENPEKEKAVSAKSKHFREQFDDEDVMLVFRKHPVVMRKGLIFGMLGIVVGVLPALLKPTYTYFFGGLIGGLLLGVLIMFPWWVRWYFSVYIMTNKRFIQQVHILRDLGIHPTQRPLTDDNSKAAIES
jgi:hypothetical protein